MRTISRTILLVVAVFLILVAVSNRETVSLALWPLPFLVDLPLYLLLFLTLLTGVLLGISATWIAGRRDRRELRHRRRRIEALERELAATQARLENQTEPRKTATPATRMVN